jgi:Polysaccharide biosynthesis protein
MLKNGFYNAAAGAVRVGLAILTIPVLIRLMGVEEYGLWALASAIVGIVTLAEAGLSTATTVFVSQDLGQGWAVTNVNGNTGGNADSSYVGGARALARFCIDCGLVS